MFSAFAAMKASKKRFSAASASARAWRFCSASIIRRCSKHRFSSAAAAAAPEVIDERIHGYTKIGIEKYHIQHLRELVAPDFPETKLGKYLLNTFVERDPWLSASRSAQIFRARGGLDMTPRLRTMKVPTLVINGEYDNSLAGGKKTASLIPGAVHKILPKTGHACNIEDPAGFDEFVIEFLRAISCPLLQSLTLHHEGHDLGVSANFDLSSADGICNLSRCADRPGHVIG